MERKFQSVLKTKTTDSPHFRGSTVGTVHHFQTWIFGLARLLASWTWTSASAARIIQWCRMGSFPLKLQRRSSFSQLFCLQNFTHKSLISDRKTVEIVLLWVFFSYFLTSTDVDLARRLFARDWMLFLFVYRLYIRRDHHLSLSLVCRYIIKTAYLPHHPWKTLALKRRSLCRMKFLQRHPVLQFIFPWEDRQKPIQPFLCDFIAISWNCLRTVCCF